MLKLPLFDFTVHAIHLEGTLSHRNNEIVFFHVIPPNANKYTTKLDKKVLQSKTEAVVWRKSAGLYKDGSGLQFIKFNLVTGGQEISFH